MITMQKMGRYGRIGNQMFQISGILGCAIKNGHHYSFPYWKNYDEMNPPEGAKFTSSGEDIDIQKWFQNPLPLIPEGMTFEKKEIPWGFHDITLPVNGNYDLEGHFQSPRYFDHCKNTIRHYFTWADWVKETKEFQIEDGNTCCILIRRGDYLPQTGYHPVMEKEFYQKAMAMFPSDTKFIVFPWVHWPKGHCQENYAEAIELVGTPDVTLIDTKYHSMAKMYMASQCRHFILPNSTYFWFPAWLGEHPEKKVVSISGDNWFGPDAGGITGNDIIPEDWIQIKE